MKRSSTPPRRERAGLQAQHGDIGGRVAADERTAHLGAIRQANADGVLA
jgi:hypothetical protein